MRRWTTLSLALGLAATLALAACGSEDTKLLPGNTAAEITENLDRVKQYAEEGECVGAENAVAEVSAQVEGLSGVDPKLVAALRRGAHRLGEVIAGCEEELETTETTPEATSPERFEPPGQEKKAEKEREREEAAREREERQAEKQQPPPPQKKTEPSEPTEPPTPPPSESGGTGTPGGVSPGAPATAGGEDE